MEEGVCLMVVSDEIEAQMVCERLRAAGLECGQRVTEATDSRFEEFTPDGPREIVVQESDLNAARALVVDSQR
jgi:hypothetical protein